MAINLGKKLKVGDTFITVTKRMTKNRGGTEIDIWNKDPTKRHSYLTYEVLRKGHERIFVKGKRQYVCRVIALVETKTGFCNWLDYKMTDTRDGFEPTIRFWQFSYLVRILQN